MTLKVSTIETTAETTDATGGWGNPKLVSWDYGKEITLTLEDALISMESLRFMLGGAIKRPSEGEPVVVRHTEEVVVGADNKVPLPKDHLTNVPMTPKASADHPIRLINLTTGVRTQITSGTMTANGDTLEFTNDAAGVSQIAAKTGDHIRIFWDEIVTNDSGSETAVEITISPSTFAGTLIIPIEFRIKKLVNCGKILF